MRQQSGQQGPGRGLMLVWGFSIALLTGTDVSAVTVYSYIDDHGNPVYTDAPETIPDQYRSRVKTHEQTSPMASSRSSVVQSARQTLREYAAQVGMMPSFQINIAGLNPSQSRILTYAGVAVVLLMLMIYLSKSQLLRMLGFCLLLVIGIGTPVLMYVSDGGPLDTMKQKAIAAGQAQQDRLQQISR